jgi:hypothetical protein
MILVRTDHTCLRVGRYKGQLEDQKLKKAQEGHLEEEKTVKLINGKKSGKLKKK